MLLLTTDLMMKVMKLLFSLFVSVSETFHCFRFCFHFRLHQQQLLDLPEL
ncbi:hypothetical protein HanRHA438_Chr11g0483351 [Helianthus annuus]|nr:hypothetical protein HanIR_Chr11g0506071 [Helianthus annuus]KAJ0868905.1 hypothetical protein HanRHA438_Chr11g0483351 [Helianthus annuus]